MQRDVTEFLDVICPGHGPKTSKRGMSWRDFWAAIMRLQAEAVHEGRACDLQTRPKR